jgi:acyl transferase domain-containing protein/NADP-dependent 3-hydroxy acid dehydrogenase YdfG/acyl carrier protein
MEIKDILRKLANNEISGEEAKAQISYLLNQKKPPPEKPLIPPPSVNSGLNLEDVKSYVLKTVAGVLKFEASQIQLEEPLDTYGIDSIVSVRLVNEFEKQLGPLSKTLFFEFPNLQKLSQYLFETYPQQLASLLKKPIDKQTPVPTSEPRVRFSEPAKPSVSPTDIAVIGMSGKYPNSPNIRKFWENLKHGFNGISEIPIERWDYREFYDPQEKKKGTICTKLGGFIEGADEFDDLLFKVLPIEAKVLDPQDRLFLQSVWESLEDAGYTKEDLFSKTNGEVGVYVGIMTSDYAFFSAQNAGRETDLFSNGIIAEVANRVSYFFDLRGPSITMNTMCSSSLTALCLACDALRNRQIQMAIVGGVNLCLHPNKYLVLSDNKFLSKDGLCKSFGEGGQGYVPSEGCGSVILKPLREALADRDHIYGVIKGTAINNCGRSTRYRVPMANSQADVIEKALSQANIHPRTISYIEAHGTGTELGDPIEIEGLTKAFSKTTLDRQFCRVGSVKSNMGHCEGAAGVASLTKALLQLKYKTLVPSIHSEKPNPHIDFASTPFILQRQCEHWKETAIKEGDAEKIYPRRAGVSSFGAGGTNAHVILEEYVQPPLSFTPSIGSSLFVLSASSKKQLQRYAERFIEFLKNRKTHPDYFSEEDFQARLAYTLQMGREVMNARLSVSFTEIDQLTHQLSLFVSGATSDQFSYGEVDHRSSELVFSYEKEVHSLDALKKAWISARRVNWAPLWNPFPPLKLSLPTYPFERKKVWITDVPLKFKQLASSVSVEQPAPSQPLLFATPTWVYKEAVSTISSDQIGEKILLVPSPYRLKIKELGLENRVKEVVELPVYNQPDDVLNGVRTLSKFIQDLLKERRYSKATFLVLIEEQEYWKYAYIYGFFLSLVQEKPTFRIKILRIPSFSRLSASILENEWENKDQMVSYQKDRRYCARYKTVAYNPKLEGVIGKEGGVYWIVGGAGGLGLLFANHFSKLKKKLTLILSGRSPLPAEKLADLKQEAGNQVDIHYLVCDVSDATSVLQTVQQITDQYGKLNGIIHSAGVLRDSLIVRKDLNRLSDVINPKVLGAINLDVATQHLPLDYMIFFSSESGAFGNIGQTDYAAANAFLDAFSFQRNALQKEGKRFGKTLSINWPLWKEGGMKVSEQVEEEIFRSTGMIPLETESGVRSLSFMLGLGFPQVLIAQGNLEKIRMVYEILPEDSNVFSEEASAAQNLEEMESDIDTQQIQKSVRELFSQVSQIQLSDLHDDINFMDYGADSIIFSELATVFSKHFELEIAPSFFFEHANFQEVTNEIVNRLKEVPKVSEEKNLPFIAAKEKKKSWVKSLSQKGETFSLVLTGEEPFFKEHRLFMRKILPGSVCLNFIVELGESLIGKEVAVESCTFERALFFESKPIDLFVTFSQKKETVWDVEVGARLYAGVELRLVKASVSSNFERQASRKLLFSSAPERTLSKDAVYDLLRVIGFEYGPTFQTIQKIEIYPENRALVHLQLSSSELLENAPFPYPLMDGMFQSTVVFVKNNGEDETEVPYEVRKLIKYREFQSKIQISVTLKQKGTSFYKVEFYTNDGDLIAECETFETVPINQKKSGSLLRQLKQFISKITSLPVDAINGELSFSQLGFGNFEYIHLQNELQASMNISVPFSLFKKSSTLEDFANELALAKAKQKTKTKENVSLEKEIAEMSDEEAEALLTKELESSSVIDS